jgi:hypothetical protein
MMQRSKSTKQKNEQVQSYIWMGIFGTMMLMNLLSIKWF